MKFVYGTIVTGVAVIAAIAIVVAYQGTRAPSADSSAMIVQRLLTPSSQYADALGNPAAKISLVEFGDYRCVHCARFNVRQRIF